MLSALRGELDLVLDAVGPDFRGVVGGSPAGTLLHHAAWIGSPERVERLLARGADPVARRRPLRHAARMGGARRRSTTTCRIATSSASRSVSSQAGAALEPRFLELADGPLAEWLQSTSIASPNE